ncbi:hypothetical protein SAHL_10640 [Salinisphaera orenii YIM 95161]|uniref:Uncharacterized protein n=2 Tax=Salinisphaera TaxID=180541 RepID=A0A423PRP3_9GAMM|nr:hypothetical protein SAHL_10640 [Salinisphaera halophila YIM 95161]
MARLCSEARINLEWLATGTGARDADTSYATGQAPATQVDTVIDADILADVLAALRARQDRTRRRWQPAHEARIAAQIYQYLIEEEQPTAEDRARVLKLVTAIVEGISEGTDTTQGDD